MGAYITLPILSTHDPSVSHSLRSLRPSRKMQID